MRKTVQNNVEDEEYTHPQHLRFYDFTILRIYDLFLLDSTMNGWSNWLLTGIFSSVCLMIRCTVQNTHRDAIGFAHRFWNSIWIFFYIFMLGICTVLYEYFTRENIWIFSLMIGIISCCIGQAVFQVESEQANPFWFCITEELCFLQVIAFSLCHAFSHSESLTLIDKILLKWLSAVQMYLYAFCFLKTYSSDANNNDDDSSIGFYRIFSIILFLFVYLYIHFRGIVIEYGDTFGFTENKEENKLSLLLKDLKEEETKKSLGII